MKLVSQMESSPQRHSTASCSGVATTWLDATETQRTPVGNALCVSPARRLLWPGRAVEFPPQGLADPPGFVADCVSVV